MSKRLQELLNKSTLSESIGHRSDTGEVPPPIDVSGPDMNAGRHSLRGASVISMDKIIPDPDQPRKKFDETELKQLQQSIEKHGLLQPIRVRWDEGRGVWVIIAGERRYRAYERLGRTEIEAICVEQEISDASVRTQQLVENIIRDDLKPCETARAYKQLMEQEGWSAAELARQLSVPRSSISESLSLLKLDDNTQQRVDAGTIPLRDAYCQARSQKQGVALEKIVTTKINKKRKRGIEKVYRTTSGAKIVVTHPRKVTDAEIQSALLEVAALMERETTAA